MLYIGTWAESYNISVGGCLYVYRFEEEQWKCVQQVKTGKSVSELVIDHRNKLLFVICETNYHGENKPGGEIQIYYIEDETGELVYKDTCNSGGGFPIALELRDSWGIVLNHGSNLANVCVTRKDKNGKIQTYFTSDEASLCIFPRKEDGSFGEIIERFVFEGKGSLPVFQESPAPHALFFSKENNTYFVPERGTDSVSEFEIDLNKGTIMKIGCAKTDGKIGPRNVVTCGNYIYVLSEIEPLVMVFEKKEKEYKEIQKIKTVAADFNTEEIVTSFKYPHPSGIVVNPSGNRLYTITRELNIMTVFGISQDTGTLEQKVIYPLDGANPRQICFKENRIEVVCMDTKNILSITLDNNGIPIEQKCIVEQIPRIAIMKYLQEEK